MCFLFVLFYVRACVCVCLYLAIIFLYLGSYFFLFGRQTTAQLFFASLSFISSFIFFVVVPYASMLFVGRTNATHAKTISRRSYQPNVKLRTRVWVSFVCAHDHNEEHSYLPQTFWRYPFLLFRLRSVLSAIASFAISFQHFCFRLELIIRFQYQ